ncbi:MAG TPA: peptidylprolyl isomerase [Acetobacteraceae bacterium]|jgi:peptidyl-prolyl cis-trans isomerase C|nr:peptidylprolyl isomerase [Acetobacteraceae bacterium]
MVHFGIRAAATVARPMLAASVGLVLLASGAHAQAPAAPPASPPSSAAPADPVVAKVNGQVIHLSDLQTAAQDLPPNARNLPPQTLYPMLLDQMIDGKALVIEARAAGLDKDPAVQRQIEAASERVLQTAMLTKAVGPSITEDALRARYQAEIAGKPGEEEVHARHILVDNEDLAKKIIAELKKGADFTALAKQYSKDPSADHSGDLGFFRKDEMVPEFSAVAFALQPGQISDTPVHTQFGWHVIQVLERRQAQPATFEQARDELRQKAIQQGIQQALATARTKVTVEKFNLDGSVPRATDTAEPPPAAKP